MSDIDPELPDYLVDAILSEGPPPEAVDLVKNAFTWRTIDAELMELSYDSVLDTAGVRDASARRTMEFTSGDISVLLEVDGQQIAGRLIPAQAAQVDVRIGAEASTQVIEPTGSFTISTSAGGPVQIRLMLTGGQTLTVPTFVL